mgnify:CR=1 FL=1
MITVALPSEEIAQPLCENARAVAAERGWKIRETTLDQAGELLLLNSVDLALTTPLGYGKGVARVDYRVIEGPCVALEDFTNAYGITFSEGGRSLDTYASDSPESFTTTIARLIMAEKFDVLLRHSEPPADCIIGPAGTHAQQLDLGEEWFDLIEAPLPLGIWVARADAEEVGLDVVVELFANKDLLSKPVSELAPLTSDSMPREGKILYRWSNEVREGLDAALHSLFYHQVFTELPAVKIYGQD